MLKSCLMYIYKQELLNTFKVKRHHSSVIKKGVVNVIFKKLKLDIVSATIDKTFFKNCFKFEIHEFKAVSRIAYEKTNGRPASQYASTLQMYKEIPVYRIITASSTVKSIFLHSNPDVVLVELISIFIT